jgi:hypothetical protein
MKSLQKMAELADRLEQKISRAQAGVGGAADTASAVVDAFFDAPGGGKSEKDFQAFIIKPDSKFTAALPESVKTCTIGATVDAKAKMGKFIVACSPDVPPAVKDKVALALNTDYVRFYGKTPSERISAKSAAGLIKPPDLQASNPSIITIT